MAEDVANIVSLCYYGGKQMRKKGDIISPKYDFCTKALFEHEEIRRGFLSDVLGIPKEEIRSTRLMNTFLSRLQMKDKQGILDIKIELNDDTKINIELQIVKGDSWDRRSLYYLSKIFVEDIRGGQDYSKIRKCIHISILDFDFTGSKEAHNVYHFRNEKGEVFSDAMEIHTIELRKQTSEEDPLYDWIRFYNSESKEELEMLKTKNSSIRYAILELLSLSGSKRARALRDAQFKASCDETWLRESAKRAGRAEGLAEGREEGREKGIEILILDNLEEGKKEKEICEKLVKRFDLTEEQSLFYWNKYKI